jgi:hypothetical protein
MEGLWRIMNFKGLGRKWYGIIEVLSWHSLGGTEENHQRLQ